MNNYKRKRRKEAEIKSNHHKKSKNKFLRVQKKIEAHLLTGKEKNRLKNQEDNQSRKRDQDQNQEKEKERVASEKISKKRENQVIAQVALIDHIIIYLNTHKNNII